MRKISISWEDRYSRWRHCYRKDGIQKNFYSKEKSEKKALKEIQEKVAAYEIYGEIQKKQGITFGKATDDFLKDYESRVRETSYLRMKAVINAHLKGMRAKRIDTITRAEWQKVIDTAFKKGATSPATLKGIQTAIRMICKFSAAHGWISDSDVPLYFLTPRGAKKKGKKILQPHELKELMTATDSWYIHAWRFMVLTGLRRGELCALQTARDFKGASIHIEESISHEGILTPGKTTQANRTIYLGDMAQKEIQAHFDKRLEHGITSGYLFCTPKGEGIPPRVLRNQFQKWREKHGIECSLHELRHTHISYAVTKTSLELDDLKKVFGHSDKMDTKAAYVHDINLNSEEKIQEQNKMKKIAYEIEIAMSKE